MVASRLVFKPVTSATVKDFETLFGSVGAPSYCWCMSWRATPDEIKDGKGPARRRQILARIAGGVPVGLIGYEDDSPAAWVSVAPRETFRNLGGPAAEPGEVVWSLTCMFVPRRHRGEGRGRQLVEAAIAHARAGGANVLEAYAVAPDSPSYRHMGFVPLFEWFGFHTSGKVGTRRQVMRLTLS